MTAQPETNRHCCPGFAAQQCWQRLQADYTSPRVPAADEDAARRCPTATAPTVTEHILRWHTPNLLLPEQMLCWHTPNLLPPEHMLRWHTPSLLQPEHMMRYHTPNLLQPEQMLRWQKPTAARTNPSCTHPQQQRLHTARKRQQ
jgi:hypothetical protein